MQITLEFFNRKGQVKPIVVDDDETIVGRGETCQLKVGSELVSREHCVLRLHDGAAWLEDLGSTNGTFLDGVRLTPHSEAQLSNGAELLIGPARARVRYDEAHVDPVPVTHVKRQKPEPTAPPAPLEPEPEPVEQAMLETCGSEVLETAGGQFQDVGEPGDNMSDRETVANVGEIAAAAEATFAAESFPEGLAVPQEVADKPEKGGGDEDLQGFLQQFE